MKVRISLLFAVLLFTACESKYAASTSDQSNVAELSGQVFIVTQGAASVKMGLVIVTAIPEADINAFLERKRAAIAPRLEAQQSAIQAAQDAIADTRKAIAAGQAAIVVADKAEQDAMRRFREATSGGRLRTMEHPEYGAKEAAESDMYLQEIKEQQESVSAGKRKLAAQLADLSKLQADADYLTTSEYYFSDLPHGITSAKTNADGEFSMVLPASGRVALAAHTSRRVFDSTEQYYWLVWASPNGAPKASVMLSNDNLTTVASPESVITLPR
jgi:hypothetical protein